jgi:hypothetical protein
MRLASGFGWMDAMDTPSSGRRNVWTPPGIGLDTKVVDLNDLSFVILDAASNPSGVGVQSSRRASLSAISLSITASWASIRALVHFTIAPRAIWLRFSMSSVVRTSSGYGLWAV